MRSSKILVAALIMALAGGCASAPSQQQISGADYGGFMSAEQCISLVEQTLRYKLKDPGSAQFIHGAPCTTGFSNNVPLLGMKAAFGYRQSGQVNGKNAFGGYVGFRKYEALLRDGRVVRYCIADDDGLCLATTP